MSGLDSARDDYKRQAEACLAVLARTNNPASQAMLTAMAHTWLRLAEAAALNHDRRADRYLCNADEAIERLRGAEPDLQQMWLRLAKSWLELLHGDEIGTAQRPAEATLPAVKSAFWH
jgi:hypothetical protein